MSTDAPLLSVAIPAWNSSPYIIDALTTLGKQRTEHLETIVSVDPGAPDRSETLELLHANAHLTTFRVIEPPEPLSMAAHYEWCLRHLSGQYVTILGADDGMMPWGLELTFRLLQRYPTAEALMFRRAYYFWPGVEAEYGAACANVAIEATAKVVNGTDMLDSVFMNRRHHFDLPQIYTNNFVHRDVVDRIRLASGGRVYHEQNPDVYSGVAVAHFATTIIRCEVPAFWTGTSPSSMGLLQSRARDGDKLSVQSVTSQFVHKSDASQHSIAPQIGNDLWLAARASASYCASADLRMRQAIGANLPPHELKSMLRKAFAGTLATWLPRLARPWRTAQFQKSKRVYRLVKRQARSNDIVWISVVALAARITFPMAVRRVRAAAQRARFSKQKRSRFKVMRTDQNDFRRLRDVHNHLMENIILQFAQEAIDQLGAEDGCEPG